MAPLPEFVPPMLARIGEPFDDPDWLFEIKWDGTRALAFADRAGFRLTNRNRNPVGERYAELDGLRGLPPGTIVDGEITVLVDGRPSFSGMLQREQARTPQRFRALSRSLPAVYMAFDLLWDGGEPITEAPLRERRALLAGRVAALGDERVLFSDGVVGEGLAAFAGACEQELEGVVAKRLASRYLPGKRTDSWLKIKRQRHTLAVILGYLPEGRDGLRSLVIGIEEEGALVPAGRVGSGLDETLRHDLVRRLAPHVVTEPVVAVPAAGREAVTWVEPALFCEVKYLERTGDGQLRAPVFVRLVSG